MGVVRDRLDMILEDVRKSLSGNDNYGLLKYLDHADKRFSVVEDPNPDNYDAPTAYYADKDKIYVALSLLSKTYMISTNRGKYRKIPLPKEDREKFDRTWKEEARAAIMHEVAHRINHISGIFNNVDSNQLSKSTKALDSEHNISFVLLSLELGGGLSNYMYSDSTEGLNSFGHVMTYSEKMLKSHDIVNDFLAESLKRNRREKYNGNYIHLVDFRESGLDYNHLIKELRKNISERFNFVDPDRGNGIMFISDDDGVLLDYGGKFYVSKLSYENGKLSVVHREIV